ncbi:hypothetical protein F5X68DRAFT_26518 [Plectosphaerella plurivora]|uniref:Uncharacterized protein n=1 Tax=Plectosphaerella plurivora TaxID=936078 RepID=A0A9P9A6E5_9PEZI|nr:hypothetical protein F5X68DRAFT_26518 [Plectosphaerella plurivora]
MPPRRGTRDQELPVEGSWRMVEGENDSFDTSIVPETDLDHDLPLSSGPSHLSSQGYSSFGASQESNHSIQDFVNRADDERVILRSPFRPSIPNTRQTSYDHNRSPDPEFYMPSMAVDRSPRGSSGRSSRTIRPADNDTSPQRAMRRRPYNSSDSYGESPTKRGSASGRAGRSTTKKAGEPSAGQRIADSVPGALVSIFAWCADIIGLALSLIKYPLAIGLAVYMLFGSAIILQNMVTKSLYTSLSPLCRIPGAGYLDLPFCPTLDDAPGPGQQVEFDDLMTVQSSFEKVLERSADGVSLPMEMKRSEASIRDLRTMVRYSELPQREELAYEFDSYIETARLTASDLQKFNTHVGSAVDSVISINRWTSRYLDALSGPESTSKELQPSTGIAGLTSWLFYPFQPSTMPIFDERALLDKYIEHTALVSDRIAALIVEAQGVLRLLTQAEDHLGLIHEITTRTRQNVESRRDSVFWDLWTLIGQNTQLNKYESQLDMLRSVNAQRNIAVAQVSALVVELEKIQAGLGDLRDRVAEPSLVQDTKGRARSIPLSVHIETIDRGVERLEEARHRIRQAENDKVREALARGGVREDPGLIDGRNPAA